MSLSTLSAQLASLRSQDTNNPGSIAPSSRRQDDAIGRGIHHWVEAGHEIVGGNNRKTIKPSILYSDNAKEIADVPLTTIRENCVAALEELSIQHDEPALQEFVTILCNPLQVERSLMNRRENQTCNAHIGKLLQYLSCILAGNNEDATTTNCLHVMEYLLQKFEVHVRSPRACLVCFLPRHEDGMFLRLIKLINLAAMPTWSFLRPFCAKDVTACPFRSVFATRASKDDSLVHQIVTMARDAHQTSSKSNSETCQKGAGRIVSFACALLVETLSLQARAKEETLRLMLPIVLNACRRRSKRDDDDDYRGFGLVLVTTMTEHAAFSAETLDKMATAILNTIDIKSIVALMAILPQKEEEEAKLWKWRKSRHFRQLPLSKSNCQCLIQNIIPLAPILAIIHSDYNMQVSPIMVSILTHAMKQKNWNVIYQFLAIDTMSVVWKETRLVGPLTATLAHLAIADGASFQENQEETILKEIMSTLRSLDRANYDTGITLVLDETNSKSEKMHLAKLMGISLDDKDDNNDDDDDDVDDDNRMDALLPPRIALEHANADVRLGAIQTLATKSDNDDDGVAEALLRHVITEENLEIVNTAALAVLQRWIEPNDQDFCELSVQAIQTWSTATKRTTTNDTILQHCLKIGGKCLEWLLSTQEEQQMTTFQLIVLLVAHLNQFVSDSNNENEQKWKPIQAMCRASIQAAFATEDEASDFAILVTTNPIVQDCVEEIANEQEKKTLDESKLLFLLNYLELARNAIDSLVDDKHSVKLMGSACSTLLIFGGQLSGRRKQIIFSSLETCAKHASVDDILLFILTCVAEKEINQGICKEIFEKLSPALISKKIAPSIAVLEIATRNETNDTAIIRLIDFFQSYTEANTTIIQQKNDESQSCCIYLLALLSHTEQRVRKATLKVFQNNKNNAHPMLNDLGKPLATTIKEESLSSAMLLDGKTTLPILLCKATELSSNSNRLVKDILSACAKIASEPSLGGLRAVSVVLNAAELAGESSFSLRQRWDIAGHAILDTWSSSSLSLNDLLLSNMHPLIESIVRMMKGVLIHDPFVAQSRSSHVTNVIISRGRRSRSYSFGNMGGVSLIDPYPDSMLESLVSGLTHGEGSALEQAIILAIVEHVVGSTSWVTGIFRTLTPSNRIKIVSNLLVLLSSELMDDITSTFLRLEMDSSDVSALLRKHSTNRGSVAALGDYIQANASKLSNKGGCLEVVSNLIKVLKHQAFDQRQRGQQQQVDDTGDNEYNIVSILKCLSLMLQPLKKDSSSTSKVSLSKKEASDLAKLIIALVGATESSSSHCLRSWKGMQQAVSVLVDICPIHPSTVVKLLIPALVSCAKNAKVESGSSSTSVIARQVIASIAPVYHDFSKAANLSLMDLYLPLFDEVDEDVSLDTIVHGLSMVDWETTTQMNPLSCFLVCLVVRKCIDATGTGVKGNGISFVSNLMILGMPIETMIGTLVQLSRYTRHLLDVDKKGINEQIKWTQILKLAGRQQWQQQEEEDFAMALAGSLSSLLATIVSTPSSRKFMQNEDSVASAISLELWQELLMLQALAIQNDAEGSSRLQASVDKSLETVRSSLSTHVFLASTTSLIQDETISSDLRARAIRFVSDRCEEIDADSVEGSLFLDVMPLVVEILGKIAKEDLILLQAASVLVERFGRCLCLSSSSGNVSKQHIGYFCEALSAIAKLLQRHVPQSFQDLSNGMVSQACCSFAICIATLVRLLQAKCLGELPKLFGTLEQFLLCVNSVKDDDSLSVEAKNQATMITLSMLRALTAIVAALPQFLAPYLARLLNPSLLPPLCDVEAVSSLERIMAQKIPARQLIPALCKAIFRCSSRPEFKAMLSILNGTIETSKRSELKHEIPNITRALLKSYGHGIIEETNLVFRVMVLKISEAQLRPIFSQVAAWCGEKSECRLAFWSLAASLCQELKFIFLPCLSTVAESAASDLEEAASILSTSSNNKAKKIKVGTVASLDYLPTLLTCLDFAFQADARQGGTWIREHKDERYHMFLQPLTRLLCVKVPHDFPFQQQQNEQASPHYQLVVQQVVPTIVSLAAAAGDETLWKPLNHAILQACDNEDSVETPRAGLNCLHRLMQTLGEEYVVLLPECLPYLSELLEADEETANLARQCVTLAEGLLGESLEDSLR